MFDIESGNSPKTESSPEPSTPRATFAAEVKRVIAEKLDLTTRNAILEPLVFACYSGAVRDWYHAMKAEHPEARLLVAGSSTKEGVMRPGVDWMTQSFESAEISHELAADDSEDFKPPSDVDILLVDPELEQIARAQAKKVFDQYGILLHIHGKPHDLSRAVELNDEIIEKGYPFTWPTTGSQPQ